MQIPKANTAAVVAAGILVVIGPIFAYKTAKWALGPRSGNGAGERTSSALTPDSATAANANPKDTVPIVVKRGGMARAFRTGILPSALPAPSGDPDQAAAELARRVILGDEDSTGALLTAIRMSGVSVRGEDGAMIVNSVKPGQGIVLDAWEVAAMAKLFGDGMQIKLVDFGKALASTLTPLKNAPVDSMFLDGIRAAANGQDSALHFWAMFIAELGRQSAQPYDLLDENLAPSTVNLDGIQISLMMRRLVADLLIQNRISDRRAQLHHSRQGEERARAVSFQGGCGKRAPIRPLLTNAAWHPSHNPHLIRVQQVGDSDVPCSLAELAAQIMDAYANVSGYGFDKLLEYLKEHGISGAGKYGAATPVINSLLAILKLIAYFACLETNIAMTGEPPLVRTQSPWKPGERRTLTATVKENIGNWQALNCVRTALNSAGIDISLPNDGPVPGAEIQWVLIGSGAFLNRDGATSYLAQQFVELVSPPGTATIQNSVGTIATDATAPKTDEHGQATIDIEGTKQKSPLQGTPIPIMKQSEVRFTVAPKPIGMSQDLIDAISTGFLGGTTGLVIGFPVEVLLRSNIHFSKSLIIPVKDWQECDGGWGGTVTYTRSLNQIHQTSSGNSQTTTGDELMDKAALVLSGGEMGTVSAGTFEGASAASWSEDYSRRNFTKSHSSISTQGCSKTLGTNNESATLGSGQGELQVSVTAGPNGPSEWRYQVLPSESPTLQVTSTWKTDDSVSGEQPAPNFRGCVSAASNSPDLKGGTLAQPAFLVVVQGRMDPNNPTEIHDFQTQTDPISGMTTQIKVDLMRCEK